MRQLLCVLAVVAALLTLSLLGIRVLRTISLFLFFVFQVLRAWCILGKCYSATVSSLNSSGSDGARL